MQFTIRDILWLTVVAAFALLWHLERTERINTTRRAFEIHKENEQIKAVVESLQHENVKLRRQMVGAYQSGLQATVDAINKAAADEASASSDSPATVSEAGTKPVELGP